MKFTDPDGNAVTAPVGLIDAGFGVVGGFLIEGGLQLYRGKFNARSLGAATAGGAVAGGLAGLTLGASLVVQGGAAGAVATGGVIAASSAAGGSTTRALMGQDVTVGTVAADAAVGLATAGVLKGAGLATNNTVFRVQGGVLPNASKARFSVDGSGGLSIQGSDMLFVNLGQKGRALEFLAKRGDEATLIQFKVTKQFAAKLRSSAVDQRLGRQYPGLPQRVDATRASDQFGIPSNMFGELLNNIVPNSVRAIK